MELYASSAGRSPVRLWPRDSEIPVNSIEEGKEYVLELSGLVDALEADITIEGEPLQALRPVNRSTGRWLWRPGFYAGSVKLQIRTCQAVRRTVEVITDANRDKLSREQFNLMVSDVLDDTLALFTFSSHRMSIARGDGSKTPPLARLEYIASNCERLEKVIRALNTRAIKRIQATSNVVKVERLRQTTSQQLLRSYRHGFVSSTGILKERLKFLPVQFDTTKKQLSSNCRENREIKGFLSSISDWLQIISSQLDSEALPGEVDEKRMAKSWARKTRELAHRLRALLLLPVFEGVDATHSVILMTPVYNRHPFYNQFFQIYQNLRRGVANVFGDFLNMPLARTFDIYELWAYLRIARAASLLWATTVDVSRLFRYEPANRSLNLCARFATVAFGNGVTLGFQRSYREYWNETDGRGSFSRTMRPDISLASPRSAQSTQSYDGEIIVLDAKYRVNEQLNDAIASLHMYRDALVRSTAEEGRVERIVRAAYLITPHVPAFAIDWKDSEMPGRLFHPEYRGTFKFGAAQLSPGMALVEVKDVVQKILTDSGAA